MTTLSAPTGTRLPGSGDAIRHDTGSWRSRRARHPACPGPGESAPRCGRRLPGPRSRPRKWTGQHPARRPGRPGSGVRMHDPGLPIRVYAGRVASFVGWCASQGVEWSSISLVGLARFKHFVEATPHRGGRLRSGTTVNACSWPLSRCCARCGPRPAARRSSLRARWLTAVSGVPAVLRQNRGDRAGGRWPVVRAPLAAVHPAGFDAGSPASSGGCACPCRRTAAGSLALWGVTMLTLTDCYMPGP